MINSINLLLSLLDASHEIIIYMRASHMNLYCRLPLPATNIHQNSMHVNRTMFTRSEKNFFCFTRAHFHSIIIAMSFEYTRSIHLNANSQQSNYFNQWNETIMT